MRTAGLNAVGELLGLARCDKPECFLYSSIESVSCLDAMVKLGPEHGVAKLAGRGFRVIVGDPGLPQPVEQDPDPFETA